MRFVRKVTIDTHLAPEAVVAALQAGLKRRRWTERFVPTQAILAGEAQADHVVLYRDRGGRRLYGEFRGKVVPSSSGTVLSGEFHAYPAWGLVFTRCFLVLWAGLAVVAAVAKWEGVASLVFLGVGALAVILSFILPRFHEANIAAEGDLLTDSLKTLLSRRGV